MIKLVHYRNKCIGCNVCVEHAPENWKISKKDGKAVLKNSRYMKGIGITEITEAEFPENKLAAEDCPVKIIKIIRN